MRSPRFAVGLLLAINLFNYIDRYVLAAVLPEIGETMLPNDPDRGEKLGWLATAFLLSYMVMSPLFGWLADRVSRWALVGCGVILWSLASGESGRAHDIHIGSSVVQAYWVLLITRLFVGVGEAAYGPAAPTIIADFYPVKDRGRVLAWFYMAIPVGSALGYGLGALASWGGNWRWGFYAVVPPGLLLGALCFFMPRPPRRADAPAPHKARMTDYLQLFRTRSYVFNCLGMAAMTFAIGGISHWMPTYVSTFRQAGELWKVNLIFSGITVVTGIAATLLGGIAGDRLLGKVRGSYFVVSGVGLLAAFPLFLLVLVTPFPYAWAFVFLAEFCLFFNTGPANTALANVAHPSVRASAFALNIFLIHLLGDAISPPIIGALTDATGGNMNVGFGVVGAMMAVGGVIWLFAAKFLDDDTARVSVAADATEGPDPTAVTSPPSSSA